MSWWDGALAEPVTAALEVLSEKWDDFTSVVA